MFGIQCLARGLQISVSGGSRRTSGPRAMMLLTAAVRCARAQHAATSLGMGRSASTLQQQLGTESMGANPSTHLQQRYVAMLESGHLKPDSQQQELVQQLSVLLQQLHQYIIDMAGYRTRKQEYEATYQQLLADLEQQQQLQRQQQPPTPPPQPAASGWFGRLFGRSTRSKPEKAQQTLTPKQLARRAAAARQAEVQQQLGPKPEAPAAPQGLYVYGSVGSGKSLLMDLFYDTATQHLQLDHSRRLHFNAAMLELHSRLHYVDQQQKQQREQHSTAAARQYPGEATSLRAAGHDTGVSGPEPMSAGPAVNAECLSHSNINSAQDERSQDDLSAEERQLSAWFDEGMLRQKQAKAAVLAIRRHLREARAGRVPAARLAAANASIMGAAARSFIRAEGPDPNSGWQQVQHKGSDKVAALLCLDEMQVGDVFSAAALKALLEVLTAEGCVIVTTSNRHPGDLPRHGLHEAMFAHFLNTLLTSCRLSELSSTTDYRRLGLEGPASQVLQQPLPDVAADNTAGSSNSSHAALSPSSATGMLAAASHSTQRLYFWPLNPTAEGALQHQWELAIVGSMQHSKRAGTLTGPVLISNSVSTGPETLLSSAADMRTPEPTAAGSVTLPVMFGRQLAVARSAVGVAWFAFEELCGRPLGAADYMAVAQHYHTVLISGIPPMSMNNRDQARRFITLIDELYNARCVLVCTAALPPDQLFAGVDGEEPILDLEGLQFEGAVEGSKLRRNLLTDGSVAPIASTATAAAEATALLGGMEERFAFSRAVSRLYEMQSPLYAAARGRRISTVAATATVLYCSTLQKGRELQTCCNARDMQ